MTPARSSVDHLVRRDLGPEPSALVAELERVVGELVVDPVAAEVLVERHPHAHASCRQSLPLRLERVGAAVVVVALHTRQRLQVPVEQRLLVDVAGAEVAVERRHLLGLREPVRHAAHGVLLTVGSRGYASGRRRPRPRRRPRTRAAAPRCPSARARRGRRGARRSPAVRASSCGSDGLRHQDLVGTAQRADARRQVHRGPVDAVAVDDELALVERRRGGAAPWAARRRCTAAPRSTACATVGNNPMNPSPRLMPVTMVPPLAVIAPVMARSARRARAR